MKRGLLCGLLALCVAASYSHAGANFTNPTQVNLLERWNSDGSYFYTTSQNTTGAAQVYKAEVYKGYQDDWYIPGNLSSYSPDVWGRFTFDHPVTLGSLMIQLRDTNHTPDNWTFSDQNGSIVSDTHDPYVDIRTYTLTSGRPASTYLQINLANHSLNNFMDIPRIGAYLATGQNLAIDGTFNVFYEENGKLTHYGADTSLLTDLQINRWNADTANWSAWKFSQTYTFTGAFLTHDNNSFNLNRANIQVSSNSTNGQDGTWTTVYGPTDFSTGYMVFSQQVQGKWARLSWADSGSGGGREIWQWQLFASALVPEPASLSLLALGGLALLRRRRK